MSVIIWDKNLSVNIREIDKQHKGWIDLTNTFLEAVEQGKGEEIRERTLHEMMDYTNYHLDYEEELMSQYGYSFLEEHKDEHQKLRDATRNVYISYTSKHYFVDMKTIDVLMDWIENHIKTYDKKYSGFLNSQGVY
jgi:hemerythrin